MTLKDIFKQRVSFDDLLAFFMAKKGNRQDWI